MWKQVIEYDPCNVKALFRRAQAYLRINELEKAEIDITKALEVDPNNRYLICLYTIYMPSTNIYFLAIVSSMCSQSLIDLSRDVKLMYKELKNKQKQYTQHEVEIFSTMLSRLA